MDSTPPLEDSQVDEKAQQPASTVPKERRFKLSRACDRCRRRRIKCDEGHPCQSCLTANSACTFEETGKRSHPQKSKRAATLEDRMHHLESLIKAISPAAFASGMNSLANGLGPHPMAESSSSAHEALSSSTHNYPMGVPPPSLNVFPLTNPSTHFMPTSPVVPSQAPNPALLSAVNGHAHAVELCERVSRLSLSPSYLYLDDEGYTRWQGETSGLPLLDLLVEQSKPPQIKKDHDADPLDLNSLPRMRHTSTSDWFPDRTPRRTDLNPRMIWKLITNTIAPDLMDSLVQCFLSTSYYLLPFLHVPTFLADYGNPQKWGEPGFAAFVVAVCCLSSRHTDDPRVKADPSDGFSAGVQWFELFNRLRTLPTADRPTLYTVQSVFVAGVYAVGLGKLSRAFALLSEAVTLSIDGGLHRSSEAYDIFDAVEREVRTRTFWCVYMWDKQAAAAFGRPPMIRLRDCDVPEPALVDDEYITRESVGPQPAGVESRMSAFTTTIRLYIVMESVLDAPPTMTYYGGASSPFLSRATTVLSGFRRHKALNEEETMLDEVIQGMSPHWSHSQESLASDDVIRVTQAVRLHCLQQFVRMLICRHRFSDLVAERRLGEMEGAQTSAEREAMMASHTCALQIIHAHLQIATKGLMTYYGVHVIHQLNQAGRTLVAVLLNCTTEDLKPLIPQSLEALRSCVELLRRFSGRYLCGLRSGDLIEEFCRLTNIPLDAPPRNDKNRMPWIRPVRKKTRSVPRSLGGSGESTHTDSPERNSPASGMGSEPENQSYEFMGSSPPFAPGSSNLSPMVSIPGVMSASASGDGGRSGTQPPFGGSGGDLSYSPTSNANEFGMDFGREGSGPMMSAELMALFAENTFDFGHAFPAGAVDDIHGPFGGPLSPMGGSVFGGAFSGSAQGGTVTSP